jgi:homoserine O-acetyltransferase
MKRIAHLVVSSLSLSLSLGMLLALPAAAHTPQQPPHQSYGEGDLKLESGEAIKDFAISYVTHGILNATNISSFAPTPSATASRPRRAIPRRSRA